MNRRKVRLFIRGFAALIALAAAGGSVCGQNRAIVDYESIVAHSVQVGDSTALALVGDVVFHHNGAILTCDSAIRYNANYIECFNNVIINQDSTYVYGDRADFNGITNVAQVYAPIIKTVDGDMTMYSYDMEFNTLTNVGRFTKGGTIAQKDNLMEAKEAIYHSDERDIFFVGDVVMRNEEYIIRTDSMGYNFDTEVTTFYRPAKIWNKDGDFLSADEGAYDRANDTYTFTRNSYILTKDQEVMADSITYLKTAGMAYLFKDIQIHDEVQLAYLFGDYGVYWTEEQQGIVTENPSTITYEEGENTDSVFMRGDSIFLHTISGDETFNQSHVRRLRLPKRGEIQAAHHLVQDSILIQRPDSIVPDSLSNWGHLYGEGADSTMLQRGMRGDVPLEMQEPPDPGETIVPEEVAETEGIAEEVAMTEEGTEGIAEEVAEEITEEIAEAIPQVIPAGTTAVPTAEEAVEIPRTKRQLRREQRLQRRQEKMREYARQEGLLPEADSALVAVDTLPVRDTLPELPPADSIQRDSLQRIVRSFRNVRIYRTDMQAVCDSLVAFSVDSTAHMYMMPVLWNENSQVAANVVHAYSKNEQFDRVLFEGEPIMSQWVLDSLYNQVTGKQIEVFFEENEIKRMEVITDAKSYYYMQESGRPDEIGAFLDIVSENMTFLFDSTQIAYIIPKIKPVYTMFPMDKIPATQAQRFPHFRWYEDIRPKTQYEVCDRVLRPTQRQESESIPYPEFVITDRINADKIRYTNEGRWRDRTETMWVDPSSFRDISL